jgi:hypothetical protein
MVPLSSMRRFCGFRSRWRILLLWQNRRACKSWKTRGGNENRRIKQRLTSRDSLRNLAT